MHDNFSNFHRVMVLACESVQLLKLDKTNVLSVDEVLPVRVRPSEQLQQFGAKADTIDILIKTSWIWFGPEMNGLMFMWGCC